MSKADFPSVKLDEILRIGQLPAMPQSALRLLDVSKDPSAGPSEYTLPIEADPGLMVQVLQFVNSSYFGFPNKISNVKQAITLVGVRAIKNFSLYSAVFSLIPDPQCGSFSLRSLWQDSLRRALFARTMAQVLGLQEAEEPFAAALLQDMAVPLLAKEVPGAYAKLFGAREKADSRIRLSALEQHVFGWNHADAAGIMARNWNLPEACASLVEDHLSIEQCNAETDSGKVAVAMSALLPTLGDNEWTEFSMFEDHYTKLSPADAPSIPDLLEQIDDEFADFAPVLRITVPDSSLVDSYHQVGGVEAEV
ncbi:MAG: HDOD domain-containing protein [Candidatus Nealsonbacteria bacterium]|nr:HDOD domain-containing protein [Candidatus Nealsonbacteria bacterium]